MLPREQAIFRRLAIAGGRPAFDEKLHVGRPNLGDKARLLERINDVLESGWLTNNGPYVREFERRIAALIGVKHCIAVCNATVGLEIAIRGLGLSGEVIVPSFTFAATAHALQWIGVTPVFCDVDPATHTVDVRDVERCITPRTTGILGVHLWGNACDTGALEKIARRHNLRLLYDAAHALGCSHSGRMIGNFGQAEVFSFHATKFCNSFEGGAITTNDDRLAARFRALRNFGMAADGVAHEVGTNGKMSEIAAAMGVTSLESLDEFVAVNQANYRAYKKHLNGVPGVKLFKHRESNRNNFQYVIVEVDKAVAGLSRDELQRILHAENVMAKSYFSPGCHRLDAYRRRGHRALPVTEQLAARTLALPTGSAVGEQEIAMICRIVATAVRQAGYVAKFKQAEETVQAGRRRGTELVWGMLQVGLFAAEMTPGLVG